MTPEVLADRGRAVIAINRHCLTAGLLSVAAWCLWPSSPEWWGLGLTSAILAVQVPVSLIAAIKSYVALRRRERAVAAYAAQGTPVRSAAMASRQAMIDAGMIDE